MNAVDALARTFASLDFAILIGNLPARRSLTRRPTHCNS